jgi:hypothetical protein
MTPKRHILYIDRDTKKQEYIKWEGEGDPPELVPGKVKKKKKRHAEKKRRPSWDYVFPWALLIFSFTTT